jgi:hypothetical protein
MDDPGARLSAAAGSAAATATLKLYEPVVFFPHLDRE